METSTVTDYMQNFSHSIKKALNIPDKWDLKLIDSGRYSSLVCVKGISDTPSLYCGSLEDIYLFLVHVVKVNYLRNELSSS